MSPIDPFARWSGDDIDPGDPVARRTFLKLMGASLALGGFGACTRQPAETIVPYVRQPEDLVLGEPLFFATSMPTGGAAIGLLVESHEGRPTKIEGNPNHPGSVGAADVFAQAAILGLYDPDRAQTITHLGEIKPWSEFLGAMRATLTAQQALGGAGLRILTESVSSPTLAAQIRDLLKRLPAAKWHQWDPLSRENAKAGAKLAFGRYVDTQYQLERADVILALDSDFLCDGPASLRYSREFAARRRPEQPDRMNRLYVVETMPTPTGSRADHRLPLRPSEIAVLAGQLSSAIAGSAGANKWVNVVAKDLLAHRGACVVMAGDAQPPAVHALAHAMNAALGNVGRTVIYTEPVEAEAVDQIASLRDLVGDMRAGKVDVLMIVGGNPVYSAPLDLGFTDALAKVPLRAHLSLHNDETSALCHWHVPEAHFLESWSDARAFDGTASIVQPLIAPLYAGRTAHEFLAATSNRPEQSSHDIVREFWKAQSRSQDFEADWRRWLHDGVIPKTAFAAIDVRGPNRTASQDLGGPVLSAPASADFDISFRLDPSVADGRFANNGWLQELPKPITKLTWDNAVLVSHATAVRLGIANRPDATGGEHGQIASELVELRYRGRTVRGALFAVEGHPDNCATVHLGYGRTRGGSIASGTGFNANLLRTSDAMWHGRGLQIIRTGIVTSLACTQFQHQMENRKPVRVATREEFVKNPRVVHEGDETPPKTITLYPDFKYDGYKWGMAIDVNACIGCNACVVACQAENNIPVVGKEQVLKGREMHWIRVDTYNQGAAADPETYFQPVPCMHCENAPCEVVCPVGATVHSDEGLNDMVYNRCVGTRYCSNNCPYKVRRFNFLLYQDWTTPSLKLGRNPNVTVRSRGVMEKCTYCVQRINRAKITSENEDRTVRDGEIQTACQQTCPADAIVFGNLNDPNSRVAKLQADVRNYSLLGELNTRPRTTYLAAVRNVNPELEG
ncbi:MAG TPA: 4Fe-4S dicluster domain-containing protein [Vicinamibacterales bacterium]|nr:4Fe-4S dicluster domain-containing protein [Vicinamibacterales bacterium]